MSAVEYWNTVKSEKNELNFEVLINDKIAELKKQTMKRKGSIFSYWGNIKKKNVDNNTKKVVSISNPIVNENEISSSTPSSPTNNDLEILTPTQTTQSTSTLVTSATESSSRLPEERTCYAEKDINAKVLVLIDEIHKLEEVLNLNVIPNRDETHTAVKNKKTELDSLLKKKTKLKQNRINQQKARERKKTITTQTKSSLQSNNEASVPRPTPGRPKRVDDDALLQTIKEMALVGSAADPRRRTEVIRSCKTLDDLTIKLNEIGFNLSRSSVYLRLLPRRKDSIEGKRHKKIANVKLCRAQPMQEAKNPDRWFASATMHHVEDFAILMGAENVAFLGKDDKALIPLGIPAANKQTPILMSMEYPVTLPDHTFVVASKHKLIPSIFASREIKESGLTYSGPTHAAM